MQSSMVSMAAFNCFNAKASSGDRNLSFEEEDWLELSNEDNMRLQDEGIELGGMSNGVGGDDSLEVVIVVAMGLCVPRRAYVLLALNGINRAIAS
jgi:hypothetical protein